MSTKFNAVRWSTRLAWSSPASRIRQRMHSPPWSLAEVTYEYRPGEKMTSTYTSSRGGFVVVDQLFELFTRLEVWDLLGGDVDARASLGIPALPGPPLT